MQKTRKKCPFLSSWACIGCCELRFGCCRPVLAVLGLCWLLWTIIGCCGALLAAVDLRWPALASVGLHSPSLTAVDRRCGPLWAKGGYVGMGVVSVVQRLTWWLSCCVCKSRM